MSNLTNYVNACTNAVWLSGYVRRQPDGTVLVHQSSNEASAIPVRAPATMNLPSQNVVTELKCHAFGRRNPATGHSEMWLEAISAKRAGIQAAPRQRTLLNALREKMRVIESPFAPRDEILAEIEANLKMERSVIEAILLGSEKRAGRDGFQNRLVLSGFVGHKAFVPPADDGSSDLGYVLFTLIQHEDTSRALPVRIRGADSRFGKELGNLRPMAVAGKIGVTVSVDDAGNIIDRKLHIETDRHSVGMAMITDFATKKWPAWWREAALAYHDEQRRRRDADRERAKAISENPAAKPVQPAQEEAAIEIGKW